jgi:protocatechuate 3,4-dioxygenase beta subunit
MHYTLRTLIRRWRVRFSYLMASDSLKNRKNNEVAKPRLVLLESRTTPSTMATIASSISAGGALTPSRVTDATSPGALNLSYARDGAVLTFTASANGGAITADASVFADTNGNGVMDAGEVGIGNTTVQLFDSSGTLLGTANSNSTGSFRFTSVSGRSTGSVICGCSLQAGGMYQLRCHSNSAPCVSMCVNPPCGTYSCCSQTSSGAIGDFVFFDVNANGIQDANESGVADQVVNLLDGNGNFLKSATTDGTGHYLFTNLAAGSYIVEFVTSPAGWTFSPPHQGSDPALDSDVTSSTDGTGRTDVINLAACECDLDVDAGLTKGIPVKKAQLGDFVWHDVNCDGIQQSNEAGIQGVTVNLLDSNGVVVATTTTDANGKYIFTDLTAGVYSVAFVAPAGYTFSPTDVGNDDTVDSDANQTTGHTNTVTLADGDINTTVDAGLCAVAAIGDFVWHDLNCNGIQDAGEPGVQGVTVMLLDANGNVVATQQTDVNGHYLFSNLDPGNYSVKFTAPAGFTFSPANQGANDNIDSDANQVTGVTGIYTLKDGQTDLSADAGLCAVAAIGDFVWHDLNCNGIQDAGEPGVQGVTVMLLDANGNVVATQQTDVNGHYLFSNLDPGNYSVKFTAPAGFTFSPANQGANDNIDSDANQVTGVTGIYTLKDGQTDLSADAGLCTPMAPAISSIRGNVYHDLNNDGIQQPNEPGIAGASLTLTGKTNTGALVRRTTFSAPDGTYEFTGLQPGTYVVTEGQPPNFLTGKNRAGSEGGLAGLVGHDVIDDIVIPAGVDAFDYDFGELLSAQEPSKDQLLASSSGTSSGHTPTLADQARAVPTSPTYGNSVAATQLADPAFARYVVSAGDVGSLPLVRVYDFGSGENKFTIAAYDSSFRGGVRVAVGDVTGDGVPDIITAPGAGGGPHIKVFDGVTGALVSQFFAYDASFTGGVYVAVGDINGDGVDEIITGAGEGGGPHVKVFTLGGSVVREFFAYSASFTGGVRVAAGDVNGDGLADIITGAGPGGGPHVKVYSGNAAQGILSQAFAYEASFTGGVYVAAGDVNGDGKAEVITGPGAGLPHPVRVFNGLTFTEMYSKFVYGDTYTGGVRVGALDIDGDGLAEVITSPGANLPEFVRIIHVSHAANLEFFLANDPTELSGVFVAGGM